MQVEVHAGDGGGGEVLFLPVKLPPQRADITPRLLHVVDGLQQHAAGATCRVVDGLAFAGIEDVYHQPHDGARGVELTRLLVRGIGELLDEVFVGLAEHVRLGVRVAEGDPGEVLDQIPQQRV